MAGNRHFIANVYMQIYLLYTLLKSNFEFKVNPLHCFFNESKDNVRSFLKHYHRATNESNYLQTIIHYTSFRNKPRYTSLLLIYDYTTIGPRISIFWQSSSFLRYSRLFLI